MSLFNKWVRVWLVSCMCDGKNFSPNPPITQTLCALHTGLMWSTATISWKTKFRLCVWELLMSVDRWVSQPVILDACVTTSPSMRLQSGNIEIQPTVWRCGGANEMFVRWRTQSEYCHRTRLLGHTFFMSTAARAETDVWDVCWGRWLVQFVCKASHPLGCQ